VRSFHRVELGEMKKKSPYAKLAEPVVIKAARDKTAAKHKALVRRVAKRNSLLRKVMKAK